jgi:hypothetical protein
VSCDKRLISHVDIQPCSRRTDILACQRLGTEDRDLGLLDDHPARDGEAPDSSGRRARPPTQAAGLKLNFPASIALITEALPDKLALACAHRAARSRDGVNLELVSRVDHRLTAVKLP